MDPWFPRSAWEPSSDAPRRVSAANLATQSVARRVPTQSVGTRELVPSAGQPGVIAGVNRVDGAGRVGVQLDVLGAGLRLGEGLLQRLLDLLHRGGTRGGALLGAQDAGLDELCLE